MLLLLNLLFLTSILLSKGPLLTVQCMLVSSFAFSLITYKIRGFALISSLAKTNI